MISYLEDSLLHRSCDDLSPDSRESASALCKEHITNGKGEKFLIENLEIELCESSKLMVG
jgi:hypothetical protein